MLVWDAGVYGDVCAAGGRGGCRVPHCTYYFVSSAAVMWLISGWLAESGCIQRW